MQPILLEFPGWGIKIHSYGVMMLLACTGALWITVWRASREKLETSSVYGLAGWLFLGGVIGARILFVIQYPQTVHSAVDLIRSWQGGNVFYGCIMGGLIGSLIYWWRHPFPFWPMADAVAPALAVGITLGHMAASWRDAVTVLSATYPGRCGSPGARTSGWHKLSRGFCHR